MNEKPEDLCTDCPKPVSRRDFTKNAAKFGLIPAAMLFFGIGGKDIIRNAVLDKKTVELSPSELKAWIATPGLEQSYPVDGLPQAQQDAIHAAIRSGDWEFFTKDGYGVFKDEPRSGVAEATCGYYYTTTPVSCCQSRWCQCYRCNGETQWCNCGISGGYNNCAWCGSRYSNCCG